MAKFRLKFMIRAKLPVPWFPVGAIYVTPDVKLFWRKVTDVQECKNLADKIDSKVLKNITILNHKLLQTLGV